MLTRNRFHELGQASAVLLALALVATLSASAVPLGPRADEPVARNTAETRASDTPSLRLAIPVLDPGIPSSQEEQVKQRIWPELRKAEAVRIAIKLKEAIDGQGTFREVVVSPDASASADFYLLARIEASNGEDLRLRWSLMDATQAFQIPARTDKHRLWDGWHEVTDAAHSEPFSPLFVAVADRIHRKLVDLTRKHERQAEKNRRLLAKGRSPKLSALDTALTTRSVVFAAFFAPDLYSDAVKEERGRLKLAYLPARDGDEWARIESIKARDERFAVLISDQYAALAAGMQKSYSDWQKDNFPLAREARLARREATWSAVAGALGAVGAVAAATDEDTSNGTAVVLAAASAAAIANSVAERKKANAMHAQINEIGASVQGALKPMVVATQDSTVTLAGTAREQFLQWRELLQDLYANTATDLEAVQFADGDEG